MKGKKFTIRFVVFCFQPVTDHVYAVGNCREIEEGRKTYGLVDRSSGKINYW